MSESQDNKLQSKLEREEKHRQEERANHRAMTLYTVVGAVVVVAAVVLMIFTSGILQRSLTAVEVNGTKYTAADVQYYYQTTYSSTLNTFYSQYGYLPFDYNKSMKKQVYDQETGQSWYDYLLDQSVERLTEHTALAAKAKAEGYALSDEAQKELDSFLVQLDTGWLSQYNSRSAYIHATFGPHMTYDRLVALAEQEILATDYANTALEDIEHPDADYEAYYNEHTDELDTITYTQFAFRAFVETTDDEGNEIQMTDEEKAAQLETLKAEQKALAEELKAKLESGEDPKALSEAYKDQLYSTALSRRSPGSTASTSSYSDWLMDSSRQAGDITLEEYDSGSAVYYYVALFEDRSRDDAATHNVRHILIKPETDEGASEATQAQLDAAEQKAQSLLDEWKGGEATEDSFSALAAKHSADGSKSNGGLISNITPTSSYVEPFLTWAVDPAREPGDTSLVQTEYGWHVMYYASTGDPMWKQMVAVDLQTQDYEQLVAGASEGWTSTTGFGMKLVSD